MNTISAVIKKKNRLSLKEIKERNPQYRLLSA